MEGSEAAGRTLKDMPTGRGERLVFFAGLAAIAALAVLIVPAWRHYHAPPAALRTRATALTLGQRTTASVQAAAVTAPTTTAIVAPQPVSLTLVAVRGASWLVVRAGSRRGKVLYVGILDRGKRLHVASQRHDLWVRAGAGQNIDLAVGGGQLVRYPAGHADVVVTPAGIAIASKALVAPSLVAP